MANATEVTAPHNHDGRDASSALCDILCGFRFSVCQTSSDVAPALELRPQVCVDEGGYPAAALDGNAPRSWMLLAEEVATERVVARMRLTFSRSGFSPRWYLPQAAPSPPIFQVDRGRRCHPTS